MMHVRHSRAVMHVGIANPGDGENVPGIPGAWTTRNFTYLVTGPCVKNMWYQETPIRIVS